MRSFHVGERPLTRLPQAGFIDIDAPGDSRGTGAAVPPPCGSAASLRHCYELIQGPFIRKVETMPKQLYTASAGKGQINVTANTPPKEGCI
ncbi:Hypothetical protein SMAX5B_005620 [Scophthalmus maximus]|uniref:Uncharacterized protein n=1 Tax=Scophthalmus maximus TaxID=52904 RepID=A0A2U9BB68_SCOMX|nr:Hypothetical protein SMAX5B_005620 [Scophthalmus maximus]